MAAHETSKRTVSIAQLAKLLGRSKRTARRVWAQARADYEAAALAKKKPWEAQGISRATWYRRRTQDKM